MQNGLVMRILCSAESSIIILIVYYAVAFAIQIIEKCFTLTKVMVIQIKFMSVTY